MNKADKDYKILEECLGVKTKEIIICQVCKKQIKGASYLDKLRKSWECNKCYLSDKSKIK